MKLKVKKLNERARLPVYANPGDAGMDLYAIGTNVIASGERQLVRTGISIELPSGTEAQIRPKSGLALKTGLTVLNAPGTIDEGYRGEIGVILINHGYNTIIIKPNTKIAQMVIAPIIRCTVQKVTELSDTVRGEGGFGSTGD